MDQIKPYTVLHIRAHVAEKTDVGNRLGLLVEMLGIDTSDVELNELAMRLQEPVTFRDSVFGTFTLDRRVNWHTAETTWEGKPVALHLSGDEPEDVEEALKTAHALWQSQDAWHERIRDFATQMLLPLKNNSWLDEDEPEVTPHQFKDRMTLEVVTVYSNGSFEFWHKDGGLFFGHSIKIDGTVSGGPTNADIAG
jgi:hypothetical protein